MLYFYESVLDFLRERAPSGIQYERNIHNVRAFKMESGQIKVRGTNLRLIKVRGTTTMTHACTGRIKQTHFTNSVTGRSGVQTHVAVPLLVALPWHALQFFCITVTPLQTTGKMAFKPVFVVIVITLIFFFLSKCFVALFLTAT